MADRFSREKKYRQFKRWAYQIAVKRAIEDGQPIEGPWFWRTYRSVLEQTVLKYGLDE